MRDVVEKKPPVGEDRLQSPWAPARPRTAWPPILNNPEGPAKQEGTAILQYADGLRIQPVKSRCCYVEAAVARRGDVREKRLESTGLEP